MPFSYHPPTRTYCEICEKLSTSLKPIISTSIGKASEADNFPFHNWYNFVLGYTPKFPYYILEREKVTNNQFIVDPFMGSGTTLVCCKTIGIPSGGVEANNFFKFAADVKLFWNIDTNELRNVSKKIIGKIEEKFSSYKWPNSNIHPYLPFQKELINDPDLYAERHRPELLLGKYISNSPFVKLDIIKRVLENYSWKNEKLKNLFYLALSSIILPSSNVRYGPGFGVIKPRHDVDVLLIFKRKIDRMILDLENISRNENKTTPYFTYLGDSRILSKYFKRNSVDLMITSPPYPGDHEYTKNSRLELIFLKYAQSILEFREIKKRMLRASTTNVYKSDNEGELISNIKSISKVTSKIHARLKEDGASSGFEKLYTKLVREYFGGMYKVFTETLEVLKPGGKFILLVCDSHAFKMVHIETAKLLKKVGEKAGFQNPHIELWQHKNSTSHKYKLLENIITLEKPA